MFGNQCKSTKHSYNIYFLCVIYLWVSSFKISRAQFHIPDDDEPERLRPCHIPTGRASFCVPNNRCDQISALISNLKRPISEDIAKYLKDMFVCPGDKTVCCPFNSISNPKPKNRPPIRDKDEACSVQDGSKTGTCTLYFKCNPLLQLLSNLQQPFPKEVPKLMQNSILCGREDVGGFNLPKVCCPSEAVKLTDQQEFERHPNRGLLTDKCPPHTDRRIVGGEEADVGEYPWLALLGYTTGRGGKPQWKCGGSLIGDQHVLTAAHCVTGLPGSFSLTKIRLGEHDITKDRDCPILSTFGCNDDGVQDFDIENVTIHEQYNKPNVFQNDIAIVKLKRKVTRNEFVKPICLPYEDNVKEDYNFAKIGEKLETWVAGWGATDPRGRHTADRLQKINMTVFDGERCRETYKKRGGVLSEESQICVGGEKGRDSCVGDSGSGLMTSDPVPGRGIGTWKLIGVVSFGPRICGTENVPGVYSRVRHYIKWILDKVD